MARFLALQYALYVERAIVVKKADIQDLNFWYDNEFGYVCSLERLYNLIIGKR